MIKILTYIFKAYILMLLPMFVTTNILAFAINSIEYLHTDVNLDNIHYMGYLYFAILIPLQVVTAKFLIKKEEL